ncbi:MAG: hypothetical protein H8K08_15805 [Nitrospira sp.]|nr:hypothetical protein [Nitrospira sp.]
MGPCKLCGVDSILRLSHILPAFAIRWLRESSGGGHIRVSSSPNVRIQDGLKLYWLCDSCEDLLGKTETAFSNKLFYPYTERIQSEFRYENWLLHFCVSLSWRVLEYHRVNTTLEGYSHEEIKQIDKARTVWKEFLQGKRPHPGVYRQHLIPFEEIRSFTFPVEDVSPWIHRYLLRAIDMDLLRGKTTNVVYSKLGRFIILGFIREDHPSRWQGAQVRAKKGTIEPRNYKLPIQFFRYINERANKITRAMLDISPRQQAKIDESLRENKERFIASDQFLAMQSDAQLFGIAAFDAGFPLGDQDG